MAINANQDSSSSTDKDELLNPKLQSTMRRSAALKPVNATSWETIAFNSSTMGEKFRYSRDTLQWDSYMPSAYRKIYQKTIYYCYI